MNFLLVISCYPFVCEERALVSNIYMKLAILVVIELEPVHLYIYTISLKNTLILLNGDRDSG